MSIRRTSSNDSDAVEAAGTHHSVNDYCEIQDERYEFKEPQGNHQDTSRRMFGIHRQNEKGLVEENPDENVERAI